MRNILLAALIAIGVIVTEAKTMSTPKRYDMTKPEEIKRWFEEMEGYLKTEDFIRQGTDFDGRCFAMDGFRQLRMIMYKQINGILK